MAVCSIAVALGVVGVIAIAKRIFFRRRFARMGYGGYGGGCGHERGGFRGFGGPPWARGRGWGRGGGRGSFFLRGILSRLDTTPGQEKEIRSAIDELKTATKEAKSELHASREAAARAIAEETFDELAIGEATVKLDAATGQVKRAFETALRKIHATLDAKQREKLSALLARGPRGFGFGGPYRDAAADGADI